MPANQPVPSTGAISLRNDIKEARKIDGTSFTNSDTYSVLRNGANINLFDPQWAGDVIDVSQVNQFSQWRNYPKNVTALTIYTNLGFGFASSSAACGNTGSPRTVYISGGGLQSLYTVFTDGKRLWDDVGLTTSFDGGSLWFKTSPAANSGDVFRVDSNGFIDSWGGSCTIPSSPSISCNTSTSYKGGEVYPQEDSINLGTGTGTVSLAIVPENIPDRYIVTWNNAIVIDTGYRGDTVYDFGGTFRNWFKSQLNGKLDPVFLVTYPNFTEFPDDGYPRVLSPQTLTFNKSASSPSFAVVKVYAPAAGTRWSYTLSCPS